MNEPRSPQTHRRWLLAAALLIALPLLGALEGRAQQAEPAAPPAAEPAAEAPAPPAPEAEPAEPEPPSEPAEPAPPRRERRQRRSDAQVIVGSSLTVDEDEVTDDVVVVGGSLVVLGEVLGDAVVVGGTLRIEGSVMGDAAAVGGQLILGEEAEVMGDALSFGGGVVRDDGARIRGELIDVTGPQLSLSLWPRIGDWHGWGWRGGDWWEFSPFGWLASQAWRVFCLALLVLFAFLALLMARGPIGRIAGRVGAEPWKCGLVGLGAQILFIPLLVLVVVILCISIIGIPFLFLLPFALLALAIVVFFGFVAVAQRLGELLRQRFGWQLASPYAVVLLGVAAIEIWSLVGHMLNFNGPPLRLFAGIFLVFGFLVGYAAWTVATGGAILTRFGTTNGGDQVVAAQPPAAAPAEWQQPASPPGEPWQPEVEPGPDEER